MITLNKDYTSAVGTIRTPYAFSECGRFVHTKVKFSSNDEIIDRSYFLNSRHFETKTS